MEKALAKTKKEKKAKPAPVQLQCLSWQEVQQQIAEQLKNPPPPLSPEKQKEVDELLTKLSKSGGFFGIGFK